MKPTLQLRLGQNLTLTPQLRQAIRLLQLSSMELELEINQALESNPLLERPEDSEFESEAEADEDTRQENIEAEASQGEEFDNAETQYEDLAPDWELSSSGSGSGSRNGEDGERPELGSAETEDLHDHLLWQLNLTPMS